MLQSIHIQGNGTARYALILLHGLGSCAENWREFAHALSLPTSVEIILPQAPTRAVTLADNAKIPAWFDIFDRGENAREDDNGIVTAQQELQKIVDSLAVRGIASENIVIGGFSQGGALSLHYGCHSPKPLAGILAMSAYLPLRHSFAQTPLQQAPVFLSHGDHDDVIPLHYAETSRDILRQHNFAVSWHQYPLAHVVDAHVISDISAWLKHILSGASP